MARYYAETLNGKLQTVTAQDDTGVYMASTVAKRHRKVVLIDPPTTVLIKLPEWDGAREASTIDKEFLDFVRRCERGSYMNTTPTDIREMLGTAKEVIQVVLKRGF